MRPQLWLLIVNPMSFDIPSHTTWWRIMSFLNMRMFMSIRVSSTALRPLGTGRKRGDADDCSTGPGCPEQRRSS